MQSPETRCLEMPQNQNSRGNVPRKDDSSQISPFFSISQKLENAVIRHRLLFHLYYCLFYRKMLQRELKLSSLTPGGSVLHIGSGPCPYTALFLARHGFRVDAMDHHPEAIRKAKLLLNEYQKSHQINFIQGDGCNLNGVSYHAIWISLNVHPKEQIIKNALSSLKNGGILVYRNLPRWWGPNTKRPDPGNWSPEYQVFSTASLLGSESVVVTKPPEAMSPAGKKNNREAVPNKAF